MGPKIPYLGIFGLELQKNIVMFEINTLELVLNEFLADTVSLVIGSAFSKGPGFNFS